MEIKKKFRVVSLILLVAVINIVAGCQRTKVHNLEIRRHSNTLPLNNVLGLIVYTDDGIKYHSSWATTDMRQGSGALAWLTGDVNNDGKTEIIQLWNSNAAVGILSDATRVLNTKDGANDVGCRVALRRKGEVQTFSTGNGIINSQADFNNIINLNGNIKVVNQINWCGGIVPNAIGCAPIGGNSFVVERFTASMEGILWAHEFGHNQGIIGDYNTPTNRVMNGIININSRRVTSSECDSFRN